ncbi:glycosyl hydrolase [Skermanella aerolata]|uniref:beta-N-acetylhexosaminidase n=1 Tax=Skermanella aerolata TaxID=393310 RepID=A0A512DHQ3_9PROT|nr:beta-N-acetylhexosaminidase [Skermanella aerolata]KJB93972.1 beta-hexosaminidase [Skermanella aerolata KACC 11604]GEO36007.1 glycosyl hydrolase [Skermanella aerolata]
MSVSSKASTAKLPAAIVYGCAGTTLSPEEREFFRASNPFGFILFRRNCQTPDQVRTLVADLRASVGRSDAPVLIDQEGGRVARMRPPEWPSFPPARRIGDLAAGDPEAGAEAAWLTARLIASMLHDAGITVDCAPVCDVPVDGSHDVIGDRAYSDDPELVASLARISCTGFLDGGVLPVIKHLPGHGRALCDSHLEQPRVEAGRAELARTDFLPFEVVADMPLGMVAHVVYQELDPVHPASTSAVVIQSVIRDQLGFDGLLFCDDLSMEALAGTVAERAVAVLEAGCDVVLHCNGKLDEMQALAPIVPPLTDAAAARWVHALTFLKPPGKGDPERMRERLDALLEGSDIIA